MSHHIFENQEHLLEYHKTQAEDYRMRHTAIWTEVKHYTWVLSVLLAAGPLAAVGNQSNLSNVQLGFLMFLPGFGLIIALIAFLIIRQDFVYYNRANARLLYIEKQLGATEKPDYLDDRLRIVDQSTFNVAQYVEEQNKIGLKSVINLRIRGLIQTTFLLYAIAALCEIGYFGLQMLP